MKNILLVIDISKNDDRLIANTLIDNTYVERK